MSIIKSLPRVFQFSGNLLWLFGYGNSAVVAYRMRNYTCSEIGFVDAKQQQID
jgi:hypothetical protein